MVGEGWVADGGRVEGQKRGIRLITCRAYGFHTAQAAAALVMLTTAPTRQYAIKRGVDFPEGRTPVFCGQWWA